MGIIRLDSFEAIKLGFTSDKFSGYLWNENGIITISTIISLNKGKGNVRTLISKICSKYIIHIPTPSKRMILIGLSLGLRLTIIQDNDSLGLVKILTNEFVSWQLK